MAGGGSRLQYHPADVPAHGPNGRIRAGATSGDTSGPSTPRRQDLSYDEDGQLIDRGQTEGAEAILSLLRNEWQFPVIEGDLDPSDPLVNTATEYMYQMATIVHHVVDGTVEVTLDETVEYEGEVFEAGTYEVPIEGRYGTDFDRLHPLEGPARSLAWTGTVHGLVGELGVGTVTHSTLQMGLGLAGLLAGLGVTFMLIGGGLAWAARAKEQTGKVWVPDTVPQEMVDEHAASKSAAG